MKKVKNVISICLCLILLTSPLTVLAKGQNYAYSYAAQEGVRSTMNIVETPETRIASTVDAEGRMIKAIYYKATGDYRLWVDNKEIDLKSDAKLETQSSGPITPSEKELSKYTRSSMFYGYSTRGVEETIVWQGSSRVTYVWTVTDNDDGKKEKYGMSDVPSSAFENMLIAVDELRDQENKVVTLGAGAGITLLALTGAFAVGVSAVEALFATAGLGGEIMVILYEKSGLQTKVDECQIAYNHF